MPYENLEALPEEVKSKMPREAQQIFMAAFNAASSDGMSDDGARQVAWNSVRNTYKQGPDGQWSFCSPGDKTAESSPLGSQQGA